MSATPEAQSRWSALKRGLVVLSVAATCGFVGHTTARAVDSCGLSAAARVEAEAGIKQTMVAYNTGLEWRPDGSCFAALHG
jgi:hypothetical protein